MIRKQEPGIALFALGMMGMGLLSVIYRDFAYSWQPVPDFRGRGAVAVGCGLFMMALGVGLVLRATSRVAVRILFPFLFCWLCLKIPAIVVAGNIEGVWIGVGELGMLLAGGWIMFARLADMERPALLHHIQGAKGVRLAQILFGLAVVPVGLGHILYLAITVSLIPSWLPFRNVLAIATGAGQIACGVALIAAFFPRVAALIETGMLTLFAFLVWGPTSWISSAPRMGGAPAGPRFALTAFMITWIIGASALLVADNSRLETSEAAREPASNFSETEVIGQKW